MRVVVTGGTGFVGAHLSRALVHQGAKVTCLDVAQSSAALDDLDDVEIVRCDVGSWAELLNGVRAARPEIIFHAAGILSAAAEQRPQAAYRANVVGTFNVLEAASLLDVERVVLTSTIATYGPGVRTVDEFTQQRPKTMYGVSKVFSELLGEYYTDRFGVDFRGIRLPSVIGPGRGPGGASAYSSLVVSEPAEGRPFTLPVTEDARIPLLYVKDAVHALMRLAEQDSSSLRRRTYGVDGFSPTAGELADAVRHAVPGAGVDFAPDRQVMRIVDSWPDRVDDSEAASDWGWRETFTLDEAVGDFVREVQAAALVDPTVGGAEIPRFHP